MTVGILTYHWEDNYGATLQAYATYRAVSELGHTPMLIDLRLPYAPPLVSRLVFALKRHRFNAFRRKYFTRLSPLCYHSVEELRANPPQCDCYLTGSDQTWNPHIAKRLLPAYFLTFGPDTTRRITYATSIGLDRWPGSEAISDGEIRRALSRFDSLLLREDTGIGICRDVFGHEATQVADPVLLHTDYSELIGSSPAPSGEVIAYKLIDDAGFYEMAAETAHRLGKPIRSIGSIRRMKGYRSTYPESVQDWVRRFASAEYVLTDSFHGTVFSLLYHKPFVIYTGDPKRVTRIESLLRQVNLTDRILHSGATPADMHRIALTPIDWKSVDEAIAAMRHDSLRNLSLALGDSPRAD